MIVTAEVESPLGPMVAGANDAGLCLLEFADRPMLPAQLRRLEEHFGVVPGSGEHPLLRELAVQLEEYFERHRQSFDLPLALAGSEFQERVWSLLRQIPYGQTISYKELARRAGSSGGQRAVGRANGDNKIAIVVPCHRVVCSDGGLGGYGGGVRRKQKLLDLERQAAQYTLFASDCTDGTDSTE